jgi:hypothetical protein
LKPFLNSKEFEERNVLCVLAFQDNFKALLGSLSPLPYRVARFFSIQYTKTEKNIPNDQ